MTASMMRIALRTVAIVIAVVALIDPAWSRTRDANRELVAIVAAKRSGSVDRLRAAATGWQIVARDAAGTTLPCAPGEHCVVIADGSLDLAVPGDLTGPLSMIADRPAGEPNIELRRVVVSATHVAAAGSARVELIRSGAIAASEIRITDAGALVGTATHKWGQETTTSIDVPWWPIQTGARVLHVEAVPVAKETSAIDNGIDVGVEVTTAQAGVLIFDARPSWTSTFVRRALEDDPRFIVGHRARVAPSLTAGTAGARLDAATLDDTAVLVIGGPDALTAGDVTLIETFVRVRGGTLLLLPEERMTGPAARLLAGTWTEHLSPEPERLGSLYASEILRANDLPLANVLASSGPAPAIVSVPDGNGHIIISGAMDAWRYREKDTNGFDRFWRSLVAEGAVAGSPLAVMFDRPLAEAGSRTPFIIRSRHMMPATTAEASAVLRCGGQAATAVRLRPTGVMGEFAGEAPADKPGSCAIEAAVDNRSVSTSFAVAERPSRGTTDTLTKLVTAAGKTRGTVVNSGDEADLIAALERWRQPSSQVVSVHPLRSAWWMIPFAACLTAEWWLRRRDGLR